MTACDVLEEARTHRAQWALALLRALLAHEAPTRFFVPVVGSWDIYAVKRLLPLDDRTYGLVEAALAHAGYWWHMSERPIRRGTLMRCATRAIRSLDEGAR